MRKKKKKLNLHLYSMKENTWLKHKKFLLRIDNQWNLNRFPKATQIQIRENVKSHCREEIR